MKTKYSLKTRFLSMLLCTAMVLGLVPPIQVEAAAKASPSRIWTKSELAYGEVNIVPINWSDESSFMNAYVYKSNLFNLNGQFKKTGSSNNKSGDTLPTGTIGGKSNGKWWASYQWTPSEALKNQINNTDVTLRFESNMIPDHHWHLGFFKKNWEWATSGVRLSTPNEDGTNSWQYGINDYGYKPNGNYFFTDHASEKDDGQPQKVSAFYRELPFSDSMFFNAYQLWNRDCGKAEVSGTVFYLTGGTSPYIRRVYICDQNGNNLSHYQRLVCDPQTGEATYTVELYFNTDIRFADNKAHDNLKLYLSAEYLDQTEKTGGFTIPATLISMGEDSMTFEFKVKQDYEHFKITKLSADQGSDGLMQETPVVFYDHNGDLLDTASRGVKLTSDGVLSDRYGNPMYSMGDTDFSDYEFDGVSPTLTKVNMTGGGITTNATEPDSWNANSGNRSNIFAGTDGDTYSFAAYFSENIRVADRNKVRAVLSVTKGGSPVELKVKSVSGKTIRFESVTVTADMLDPGERIYITEFKNLSITDPAGNPYAGPLSGNGIIPAQQVYLDVDKPYISTSSTQDANNLYTVYADAVGERFSFPVTFYEADKGVDNSGIAGTDVSFMMEMQDGSQMPYKWYMDTKQTISTNATWNNGTTGSPIVFKDVTDKQQYWVHVELDKNTDYGYSAAGGMDENGVYFRGKFTFDGLKDWAGNTADAVSYSFCHQVDTVKPAGSIASAVSLTKNYSDYSVTCSATIGGTDNYSLEKLYYQWEYAEGDGDFQPVGDGFTAISGQALGTGLIKQAHVSVGSFTRVFGPNATGKVRLKMYAEDLVGGTSAVVYSDATSFGFAKVQNNSYVTENSVSDPSKLPVPNMTAPTMSDENYNGNTPVSLLVIPDIDSKDAQGNYTQFWMWVPQYSIGSDSSVTVEYTSDPVGGQDEFLWWCKYDPTKIDNAVGSFVRLTGTIDTVNASGAFTEAVRLTNQTAEENTRLYNYLTGYYGSMELYTVATTSLGVMYGSEVFANAANFNFASSESDLSRYTVYLLNGLSYQSELLSVTNAEGKTDAQVEAEGNGVKLHYVKGEGRRPAVNLDNVAVSVRITNVTDPASRNGVSYGMQYLDGTGAFTLYKGKADELTDFQYYPDSYTKLKTWDWVHSADGINTVVLDPGLCAESGWYTMVFLYKNTWTGETYSQIVGNFFMHNEPMDIEMVGAYKEVTSEWDSYSELTWEIGGSDESLQTMYANGEEIWLGLAPLPEGWEYYTSDYDAYYGNYLYLYIYGYQTDEYNYLIDDLERFKVYNQTYNAVANLEKDAGIWRQAKSNDIYIQYYYPYLADANQANPYGDENRYDLPFVAGANLIVYQIQAANGLMTTKEMVVYVDAVADDWELAYEVSYHATGVASKAKVWPVGAAGEALELNLASDFNPTMYNFRQKGYGYYNDSYSHSSTVENAQYSMIDPLGNVSLKTLTIADGEGNPIPIDSRAPYSNNIVPAVYDGTTVNDLLRPDREWKGDTFLFDVYSIDAMSEIDFDGLELVFDEQYSAVLPGGTKDEEGRVAVKIPIALDENGEPLKNEDGSYAYWEGKDPQYNGIYRTQLIDYGYMDEWNKGHLRVRVWGAWKYDTTVESFDSYYESYCDEYQTARNFYVGASDINGQRAVDEMSSFLVGGTKRPYSLQVGAYNPETTEITMNELNEDGVVGIYSTVPFQSISGYGVEEMIEIESRPSDSGFYSPYAPEGHYFYTTVPMITQDGTYTFTVVDLFGETHKIDLVVNLFGWLGVDVSFSTTEPTNKPVTVYANSTGNYESITSIVADNGTVGVINPLDPTNASITVDENCIVTVTTDSGAERKVRVANIDTVLEPVTVLYYDEMYNTLSIEAGATEVIAVLSCDEAIVVTNGAERHTFGVGSKKGDTYTFEYQDLAGNTGTVTATLPLDLIPVEPDVDEESPDVTASLYAYRKGGFTAVSSMLNPITPAGGESGITSEMNSGTNIGYKAQKFRLVLNVQDESDYKIVVVPAGEAAPTSYNAAQQGSTAANVTMTVVNKSATLEISENVVFDIHVIDANNNISSMTNVQIETIDKKAPTLIPRYETVPDPETGYINVVATFHPTDEDKYEPVTALTADVLSSMVLIDEGDPDDPYDDVYAERYYHVFEINGSYGFTYEDDAGNIGEALAQIKGLTTDAAVVNAIKWYGTRTADGRNNVTPDKSAKVNQVVTAQLRMNKAISEVEMFEGSLNGAMLDENSPVKVHFTATTIDVVYTENVDYNVVVRFTASANGRKGTYTLPVVGCIDMDAPMVTPVGTEVRNNSRALKFTFETNEKTLLSGSASGGYSTTHSWTATEAKPVTLQFTDEAGNCTDYIIDSFPGLDTVKLDLTYSASANGANPTEDPLNDLTLFAGGTFYVKANKAATGTIGGKNAVTLVKDRWTAVTLPNATGIHILSLTDTNTGELFQELVSALPNDAIAPVLSFANSTVLVYETDTVAQMMEAVNVGVTVTDNVDDNVPFTVTGYPDSPAQGGLYTLTYTAQDSAGNKISAERTLYIMDENAPILRINGEVGLPYGKVFIEAGEIALTMQNMTALEGQPVTVKFRKGLYTTGQMKYYATTVEDMTFQVTETGHYTIYVRGQDRTEFVTYIYVED